MGTDIHFYVERRNAAGAWETCDVWEEERFEADWDVPYGKRFYESRNYDLFAILAGVRNGRGFAGVETGSGFVPIHEPRGLPQDMSPELQRHVDQGIEHTPSWATVAELLAYDWTRETIKVGVVELHEYLRWRPMYESWGEWPEEWCGDIVGPKVVVFSEDTVNAVVGDLRALRRGELDDEIAKRFARGYTYYVNAQWHATYARCARDFLETVMPRLWRLGKPEDVRCVYYFDS